MSTVSNAKTAGSKTKTIAIYAIFIALTYVCTWLINIRLPFVGSGGLIHLGNVPMLVGTLVFGWKAGAIAGSFGMALFDLTSGWLLWSPFTFVIVGLMGLVVGMFAEKKPIKNYVLNAIVAILLAIGIKVGGYYIAEGILYGNWIAPVGSIPGNIIQVSVAAVIAIPVAPILKRVLKYSE